MTETSPPNPDIPVGDNLLPDGTLAVPADTQQDRTLYELARAYDEAKAVRDDAEKKLKAVTDALKSVLTSAHVKHDGAPHTRYLITSRNLTAPLVLNWVTANRFNVRRFSEIYPDTYSEFTEVTGSWRLERKR